MSSHADAPTGDAGAAAVVAVAVDGELSVAADGAAAAVEKKTKAQRKKANRKANKRAANALVQSLLAECNGLTHSVVFSPAWFRAFQRYKQYRVYYLAASDLSEGAVEWIFGLTKLNMKRMYEKAKGWGWSDDDKRAELTHADARYFIVTRVDESDASEAGSAGGLAADGTVDFVGDPVAFCHIRFTTGDQDQAPIAYVYELQLESSIQRQGIGRFLMSLVELFSWRCQLRRVVLTVFRSNTAAQRFYTRTLNYTLDDTDPELWEQDENYQILAKRNKKATTNADIQLPLTPVESP